MSLRLWKTISLLALIAWSVAGFANEPRYTRNQGQWHEEVLYRTFSDGGYFYIEKNGITLQLLEEGFFTKLHDSFQIDGPDPVLKTHVVKMRFSGANLNTPSIPDGDINISENYFLGSDTMKWARNVRSFERVSFKDIYESIDLRYGFTSGNIKYEFIVGTSGDPSEIKIRFDGAEDLYIRDSDLYIQTSVGNYVELAPFAYQVSKAGKIEQIRCEYRLKGKEVSYYFPNGYDTNRELIIDPEIAFSTYVGSNSDNFGFTASYDNDGNLYGGGIVFGPTYPTLAGAFQNVFGGGSVDCGITKFNEDGSALMYSTYLGGQNNEAPHSLVVNNDNELYIYGSSGSFNFPTTTGSFQSDFQGGNLMQGLGFDYPVGTDIFVSRLSADGTQLLSSTYVGGSGNDGVNENFQLNFNYGDLYRGEIIVDEAGGIVIASMTESQDFPFQNSFSNFSNGQSNGVVFKLSPDLSNLEWGSSTGGANPEALYGVQLASNGEVYVAGGTSSTSIPGVGNGAQSTLAGQVDGFILRISADGSALLGSTYNGTPFFDQNYFVQLDTDNNVYVVGQSTGSMPISAGVYSNAGSGQYLQKYNPELTELLWSTQVGSSSNGIDISPSAFLVTLCDDIYISGWGGVVNSAGGSTAGLPTTVGAFQPTTDGSDFYLMVLEADAASLQYATFFGGNSSAEHVDGGTSRFDKNGTVYQAVCAGCGGQDDFPSTPGVWSPNNPSTNCNLGVFKFRLSSVNAAAEANFESELLCTGEQVTFTNLSEDADQFLWNFGDGTTSTEENPIHLYTEPGTYFVTLLAEDSNGCLGPDSETIEIIVEETPDLTIIDNPEAICPGETITLSVSGADSYVWSPATGLSNPTVPNPVFNGNETTTYTVTGSTQCGTDEAEVTVTVGVLEVFVEEEVTLCPGESFTFNATGGTAYSWTPETFLDDPSSPNATTTPETNITYQLEFISDLGCNSFETVDVNLLPPPPVLTGTSEYTSCNGSLVQLGVSGGSNYVWSPSTGLSNPTISNPFANPGSTTVYTVTSENECGEGSLEVTVNTSSINISMETDSIVCFQNPFVVSATGANTYRWTPAELFQSPNAQQTTAEIESTTLINVTGYNEVGCSETESRLIRIYPRATVRAGNDRVIHYGEEIILESFSIYPVTWEDHPELSCLNCNDPVVSPLETSIFYATIVSPDGCIEKDSVVVTVIGNIYVPNAFTPDGDGINDIFRARGIDIVDFQMEIFNRWGELIFKSDHIDDGWNGESGNPDYFARSDIYPYRIVAREHTGKVFEIEGYVTLIR